MSALADRIVVLHRALDEARLPHAFGGALALAWCTHRARGTIDVDVNVFVPVDAVDQVIAALPSEVNVSPEQRDLLQKDGQVRLWWDATPLDLFFANHPFHAEIARRLRHVPFEGVELPVLECTDLAVFKAFFNRTKDWADIEAMLDSGTLDVEQVVAELVTLLGDDARIERLRAMVAG